MLSREATKEFLNQMQDIGRWIIGVNASSQYMMEMGFISQGAAEKAAEDIALEAQARICMLVRRYFGGDRKESEHGRTDQHV